MDNWQTEDFLDTPNPYGAMKQLPPQSYSPNISPAMSRANLGYGNVTNNQMPNQMPNNQLVTMQQQQPAFDSESLHQLKAGMAKIMQTLERLETRLNRVEQTTSQILKQQQETLSVPFMSQAEIDKARQVAEQMEQDDKVAKQLQAAYNKETEVKKNVTSRVTHLSTPSYATAYSTPQSQPECPICGLRVNQGELEVHVDNCLEMFSNDPKKETEVKETRKKVESGFFGRLFKSTKIETTKTVVSQSNSQNAPLLEYPRNNNTNNNGNNNNMNEAMMNMPSIYPTFAAYPGAYGQPPHSPPQFHPGQNQSPMMMPMYMYPSYPHLNQQNYQQE